MPYISYEEFSREQNIAKLIQETYDAGKEVNKRTRLGREHIEDVFNPWTVHTSQRDIRVRELYPQLRRFVAGVTLLTKI